MKKRAIYGLLILAAVVLICIFLSGTLHTMTTAKVQMTSPRTGRLEYRVSMSGALYWSETEELGIEGLQAEDSLTVVRLLAAPGSYVKKGETIAECRLNDYDSRLETLQKSYAEKGKEAEKLDETIRLGRSDPHFNDWIELSRQLTAASEEVRTLRQELLFAERQTEENPEAADSEEMTEIRRRLEEAEGRETEAQNALDRVNRLSIDENLKTAFSQRESAQRELTETAEEMARLQILREKAALLTAPHSGYITALNVKTGDRVDMNTVVAEMAGEGTEPVIRLDASGFQGVVPTDAAAEVTSGSRTLKLSVVSRGVGTEGRSWLDLALRSGDLTALGGAGAVSEENSVTAELTWREESASTLIPIEALRGSDEDAYVYIVRQTEDVFRVVKYTTEKKEVKVLGKSGTVASIADNLRNMTIAYMEDRPLSDGCEVIPYSTASR